MAAKIDKATSAKVAGIQIAHSTVYQPVSKKVVDMRIEPLGYARFDGVSVK